MMRKRAGIRLLVLVSVVAATAGCPRGLAPVLSVNPDAISFPATGVNESIAIFNSGGGSIAWTAREVMRQGPIDNNVWIPADIEFLSIDSDDGTTTGDDIVEGDVTTEVDRVDITVDRTNLSPGLLTGYGIEISSAAGTKVVPVAVNTQSSLAVTPREITIPENSDRAVFTVQNRGGQSLNVNFEVLSDPADPLSVIELPSYISQFPSNVTVPANGQQTVIVTIDREGLAPDLYEFFVLAESSSGFAVVTVTFGVGGFSNFDVTPDAITIPVNIFGNGEEAMADFTIANPGDETIEWELRFEDPDIPGIEIDVPGFISITPISGTVSPDGEQIVSIDVNPAAVPEASITDVNIVVEAPGVGTQSVVLRVIAIEGPRLSIQQLPPFRRAGLLDFGTEEDLLVLGVGNTGGIGTLLEFTLSTDRPDLIQLPFPPDGESIGTSCPVEFYLSCYDWQSFPIVIDRAAMNPAADVDGGEILIEAPGQDPVVVAVTVTRAPLTIEGAMNQSRPPSLFRFIFLLRDSLLNAVDTTDPDVLRSIQWDVEENDEPLELDETNFYVTGPENLKHNMILLLDYSGSMFNAGEEQGIPNGQVLEEMVAGAREFIDDLPDNWRVALWEYHERNQVRRELHPFTTDHAALTAALDSFSLSPAEHGASEIRDALSAGIDALVSQDPASLPFDEADLRSIVYVTDGHDTSSMMSLGEVLEKANDARVRLYPIAFGDLFELADLTEMAKETGGHLYKAIAPRTLTDFLGRPSAMGQVLTDLSRQVVLQYITLLDMDSTYRITATLTDSTGAQISGQFQRDAIFFPGDFNMGQITLSTSGISDMGGADVFVRTDFMPRNITQLRFRFIVPPEFEANLTEVELLTSRDTGGILQGWRLVEEGDNVYTLVTDPNNPLPFGVFGSLLRLGFEGLDQNDVVPVGFRVDNSLYIQADPNSTVNSRYFAYPGSLLNPFEILVIEGQPDIAPPSESVAALQIGYDPTAPSALDLDEDGVVDFDDPEPFNADLPTAIVTPDVLTFPASTNQSLFRIRNNRLDTMEWEIAATGLGFGLTFSQSSGTLPVGGFVDVIATVDRTGLPSGTFNEEIDIVSSLLAEPHRLPVTVEVF